MIAEPKDDRYLGITRKTFKQALKFDNDRDYDVITFYGKALPDRVWMKLKAVWRCLNGIGSPGFDIADHLRRRCLQAV